MTSEAYLHWRKAGMVAPNDPISTALLREWRNMIFGEMIPFGTISGSRPQRRAFAQSAELSTLNCGLADRATPRIADERRR